MKRVLVIVVSYNGMQWIHRCLSSVQAYDTVVIDNGSTDGTREHIASHFPGARLICCEQNQGFGAANNIGLRIALEESYDFAYLLNQDAWLLPGCLEALIAAWRPGYAVLSPLQKAADGSLDANFRRKCGRYLGKQGEIADVPFVMAAHWLMSTEAVRKVGGFSPMFHQYGEDDNYLDRAHFHGLKAGVVPGAEAVHDRAQRVESKQKRMNLKCIAVRVRLSDPACKPGPRKLRSMLELVGMAAKNLSFAPLAFIPKLLSSFPELDASREASKADCAFLI